MAAIHFALAIVALPTKAFLLAEIHTQKRYPTTSVRINHHKRWNNKFSKNEELNNDGKLSFSRSVYVCFFLWKFKIVCSQNLNNEDTRGLSLFICDYEIFYLIGCFGSKRFCPSILFATLQDKPNTWYTKWPEGHTHKQAALKSNRTDTNGAEIKAPAIHLGAMLFKLSRSWPVNGSVVAVALLAVILCVWKWTTSRVHPHPTVSKTGMPLLFRNALKWVWAIFFISPFFRQRDASNLNINIFYLPESFEWLWCTLIFIWRARVACGGLFYFAIWPTFSQRESGRRECSEKLLFFGNIHAQEAIWLDDQS